MIKSTLKHLAFCTVIAALQPGLPAFGEDRVKGIVNALEPSSMNELLSMARTQPDAALTNVMPAGANKFRFLFVWPASNTLMTFERIGRSFAERLIQFASQQNLLALGYCLPTNGMVYGSTLYAGEEVNVAYRDIEVRFAAGRLGPCAGRYIDASELSREKNVPQANAQLGTTLPVMPPVAPAKAKTPEEELKPFLRPPSQAR